MKNKQQKFAYCDVIEYKDGTEEIEKITKLRMPINIWKARKLVVPMEKFLESHEPTEKHGFIAVPEYLGENVSIDNCCYMWSF